MKFAIRQNSIGENIALNKRIQSLCPQNAGQCAGAGKTSCWQKWTTNSNFLGSTDEFYRAKIWLNWYSSIHFMRDVVNKNFLSILLIDYSHAAFREIPWMYKLEQGHILEGSTFHFIPVSLLVSKYTERRRGTVLQGSLTCLNQSLKHTVTYIGYCLFLGVTCVTSI